VPEESEQSVIAIIAATVISAILVLTSENNAALSPDPKAREYCVNWSFKFINVE
jgi:hypothetical protein